MASEDDIQSEDPEMDCRLEHVGSGIVDTNDGLEATFKMLQLEIGDAQCPLNTSEWHLCACDIAS